MPDRELAPHSITQHQPPKPHGLPRHVRCHPFRSEMEIVSTGKFTVFEHGCRAEKGGANNSGSRGPPAFAKDVPTMRLREMNAANASRYSMCAGEKTQPRAAGLTIPTETTFSERVMLCRAVTDHLVVKLRASFGKLLLLCNGVIAIGPFQRPTTADVSNNIAN